jgi:hypothetical protein
VPKRPRVKLRRTRIRLAFGRPQEGWFPLHASQALGHWSSGAIRHKQLWQDNQISLSVEQLGRVLLLALLLLGSLPSTSARAAEFAYLAHHSGDTILALASEGGKDTREFYDEAASRYFTGGRVALSSDGQRVAYCMSYEIGATWENYVIVDNANTGESINAIGGPCESLDFSPDGERLLLGVSSEGGMDIWEWTIDESEEPREVIGWGGDQRSAHYAPDGQHIVFSSNANAAGEKFGEAWPYKWHLFKAKLDGTSQTNLTNGSPLWTEKGADYADAPDVRINNETIVFECGFEGGGGAVIWNLCRINMDGTSGMDLGVSGHNPQWSTNGFSIVYSVGSFPEHAREVSPLGEESTTIPLGEIGGVSHTVVAAVPRQTSQGLPSLARNFRPNLRLDEGERWRPLELDEMLEEGHRVCVSGECEQIWEWSELAELSGPEPSKAVLDIAPVEGEWDSEPHVSDADDYGSPDCTEPEAQGVDCEDYEHTAIHYDASKVSPGGYRYLQYWFFYRFNDSPVDTNPLGGRLDHEADWERIAVAVPEEEETPATFDYATFDQHGDTYAYLRKNLSCNQGQECGGSSKRLDVYVAGGTHASYAGACTSTEIILPCFQSNGITPETDHGGEVDWIGDIDAGTLRKLPAPYGGTWLEGPQAFTDWPGQWGFDEDFESHVDSPANQPQFNEPWDAECYGGGSCNREKSEFRAAVAPDPVIRSETPLAKVPPSCQEWFGAEVVALLCSPSKLRDSLARAAIDRREGTADLTGIQHGDRQVAPTTGGLAQLVGAPLAPGDELVLSGHPGRDAVLLVRAVDGQVLTQAIVPVPAGKSRLSIELQWKETRAGSIRYAQPVLRPTGSGTPEEVTPLSVARLPQR